MTVNSLKVFVVNEIISILKKYNLDVATHSDTGYTSDLKYIILSNYEQTGMFSAHGVYKKKADSYGLVIDLTIGMNGLYREYSAKYFPKENGKLIRSLFASLDDDLNLFLPQFSKTILSSAHSPK